MEVRSARPPANRAVAALQSASATAASASPLLPRAAPHRALHAPITRYVSFDALRQAQQKPDENAALREELHRKLPQPTPRNDIAALGDGVTVRILELLNPLSADAAAFSETCRAVRDSLLRATDVESVVVIPEMVSSVGAVESTEVQETLHSFFVARGGEVRRLTVRRADETTADAARAPPAGTSPLSLLSPPRLPAPWVLQLVAHMPYLVELDLRHVQWGEAHGSQALPHLLSDLHIATPGTLRTLKIDPVLMQYWTPGWWRRHVNLSTLTVGSRYRFASSGSSDGGSGGSPPTLLELPMDFYTLMREDGGGSRHWQLELWCPLKPHLLQPLLAAGAGVSYAGVEELLVNVRHNELVCEGVDHGAASAGGAATTSGGGGANGGNAFNANGGTGNAEIASTSEASVEAKPNAKGRKAPAVAEVPEVVYTYPRLHTLTVVDVGERPESAAEAYQTMLSLAPELRRFNVCDTVVIGAAASVESGRSERSKRAGGAAATRNVN